MSELPGPAALDAVEASSLWRALEYEPVVTSTNALLLERARAGEEPGLVLVAERQTAGRGRLDRRWEDRPGGSLAVSFLVDRAFPRPTLVPLATGLAVVSAIRPLGVDPHLKWPNDVLVGGRKCCGILAEAAPAVERLVIGVGLNIDWRGQQRGGDWTSLAEELDGDVDASEVLARLAEGLERTLTSAREAPEELVEEYRGACDTIGRDVNVEVRDGVISGRAEGVGGSGALIVATGERRLVLAAGDVEHVRPA